MIVTSSKFKTGVVASGTDMMRICTGHRIEGDLHEDDCPAHSKEAPEGTVIIYSRRDVFKSVKTYIIMGWLLVLACFVGMCTALWYTYMNCIVAGRFIVSVPLVLAGLSAAAFVIFLKQMLQPIVHDSAGHWVNLKNGSSNLCGGIVVRKKARWV